ncbi:MAG: aminopeptidase [Clostridiaceae bacterium]|jgi:aminopeptidase|nr:aminopeptidase [Clostridiaceae bacterium]
MNKELVQKFARLIVEVGVDVQKGQNLVINAPLEARDLVREISRIAYQERQVQYVIPHYEDDRVLALRLKYSEEDFLFYQPDWESAYLEARSSGNLAEINLRTADPSLAASVHPHRFDLYNRAQLKIRQGYRRHFNEMRINWVSLIYPTQEWAKQVYPDLPDSEAYQALMQDFIKINRLDQEDPVQVWKDHFASIDRRKRELDDLDIVRLHFEGPGTQLEVGLVEGGRWAGGALHLDGKTFAPNIPTEEVFHLPHKYKVQGTVRSTLPLSYQGKLLDGMTFTFRDGKVVDFSAQKGQDVLQKILEVDSGSSYLGEVALVTTDSPIFQSGKTFYTTLYDENAVCHLALGNYASAVVDGIEAMTEEETNARGINRSLLHVDFMIGSTRLDVLADLRDGKTMKIMEAGKWLI